MTDKLAIVDRKSLAAFISSCPIIDQHAYPLRPLIEQTESDVLATTTEASGSAQLAESSSLPFIRAVNSLCQGECLPSSDASARDRFQQYLSKRRTFEEVAFTQQSLTGLQTILLDDGSRHSHPFHPCHWHSQFLKSPARRIVQIESLAEDILHEHRNWSGEAFNNALEAAVKEAIADKEVAGFKSAVCYRSESGLHVSPVYDDSGVHGYLQELTHQNKDASTIRINNKSINDFLLNMLARLIRDHSAATGQPPKPIQLHTGFGDTHMKRLSANPLDIQPFIEAYPDVPIVLVHSSWPFTREAGYLASIYANVYLDVGQTFAMVSRTTQEQAIREALALTPIEKLCWSTHGHTVQETYSATINQMREILVSVLHDMVLNKDCTFVEAGRMVKHLLFDTSNQLYHLGLRFEHSDYTASLGVHSSFTPLKQLEAFLSLHPSVRFIRHSWVDYTGTVRVKVLTVEHLRRMLSKSDNDGRIFDVAVDAPFLLQNDAAGILGLSRTGQIPYIPDYNDLRLHPRKGYASAMGDFRMHEGGHNHQDPRTLLKQSLESLEASGITNMLVGFELEFYLFDDKSLQQGKLVPISTAHAWSTASALLADGGRALTILEDIVTALQDGGVNVEQFHSASGDGQYEIPLGPLPVLQAVDQLIFAKEVVSYIAALQGYRATFHPKPMQSGACSGLHVHMSFDPASKQDAFYAGILEELPSICAFSLGSYHSYDRVVDGAWTGGTWCAWGEQNHDTPLRRIDAKSAHWELKAFDGLANPYLALAAILIAGGIGVEQNMPLPTPITVPASTLSPEDRAVRGIKKAIPKTLKEALSTFFSAVGKRTSLLGSLHDPNSRVTRFIQHFGAEPAIRYTQVKEQELALLKQLEPQRKDNMTLEQVQLKTRIYMIERY